MKEIELSDKFSYGKLLLFSLPAIGESLATTSFQLVDGYFVSKFLGVIPFAAVNIISPVFFILYGIGTMFGTGSSAVISQCMGRDDARTGRRIFSMSVAIMEIAGVILGALATLLIPYLSVMAGADEETLPYCIAYGRLLTVFLPAYMVNSAFMTLWITAEKSVIGLFVSAMNGAINVFLDWLFMGVFDWGIQGAALATSLAAVVDCAVTLVYFSRKNSSSLRFERFNREQIKELKSILANGFSEMIDYIASNVTGLIMNVRLIQLIGELGVVAIGIYDYVCEFFFALFYGFSSTAITVVGYKYGEKNKEELNSLLKKFIVLSFISGGIMCVLSIIFAKPIAGLYVGYDAEAFELSAKVLKICALTCNTAGFVMIISSFFTGLEDWKTSAIISLCSSFAAVVIMLFLLPALFGDNAIWYSIPSASALTAVLCLIFIKKAYPPRISKL